MVISFKYLEYVLRIHFFSFLRHKMSKPTYKYIILIIIISEIVLSWNERHKKKKLREIYDILIWQLM